MAAVSGISSPSAPRPESRLRECLGVVATGVAIVAGLAVGAAYVVTLLPSYFPEAARDKGLIGLGAGIVIGIVAKTIGDRCQCSGERDQGPGIT